MGRQFQTYLLPRDVVELVAELRLDLGVRIIAPVSPTSDIVELESPLVSQGKFSRIDCLLVAEPDADVRTNFVESQNYWLVDSSWSEVIEFSGCHFDGNTLRRGRMWFEPGNFDNLGNWQRKPESFVKWADALYRRAKRFLARDTEIGAYLGGSVPSWRQAGGQLIAFAAAGVAPVIAGSRKLQ